jgi:predicted site-specific integrase-resolvase
MVDFAKHFKDPVANKSAQALSIAEDQISDLQKQVRALKEEKSSTERREVLESVLKPLSGIKREQMEILLSKVATDKLQEAYNSYIGRLLREDAATTKEVVVESAPAAPVSGTMVTGDKQVNESTDVAAATALARAKRLAGICN